MQRIDGKALADRIRTELATEIAASRLSPKLGVLLVGDDPASHLYVTLKERACQEVGIATDIRRVPAATSDAELLACIQAWNQDSAVHGILVQLPLPEGHATDSLISAIDPNKDVDGFHPETVAKLLRGEASIISPVHEGILRLIAATDVSPNRTPTMVIAKSEIFSAPIVHLLKTAGAFVRSCTPDTLIDQDVRASRIIVVAVGRPRFLTRDLITSGTCVIDVGTNPTPEGRVVGDVDADHVQDIPGWLSPVPGGVGPLTIALLLKNVVTLARHAASRA